MPIRPLVISSAALLLIACGGGGARSSSGDASAIRGAIGGGVRAGAAPAQTAQTAQTATPGAWVSLFNGQAISGWHNYKTPGAPVVGWSAINGELVRSGPGGDLTTDKQYTNFELELEWKVEAGGNSGIIYRIDPASEVSYTSGPEMQILDDTKHPDGKNPLTSAGANYALHAPPAGIVKPVGEWNAIRLIVNGNHVEHWLNGIKAVEYELGSPDWETRRQASKFATWTGYGRAARGYIALQDHGDRVAFRNLRIRELP
ncbi:3-keto-disaccharide hydrolase [Gemmatimonas aurantiaca]|nr:DUF1080 domain-containing protein [Gemmatimonas aurantiaca]